MRRLFYHLLDSIAGPEQTGRVPRELLICEIYELPPLVNERHRLFHSLQAMNESTNRLENPLATRP